MKNPKGEGGAGSVRKPCSRRKKLQIREIVIRIVVVLLLISSLACYFFPFATVRLSLPEKMNKIPFLGKYLKEGVDITASGAEFATGQYQDETVDTVNHIMKWIQKWTRPGKEPIEIPLNVCVTVAFVLTLIALGLACFRKTGRTPTAVVAALGAIALIVFRFTFESYYRLNAEFGPFDLILFQLGPYKVSSILAVEYYRIIWVAMGLAFGASVLAMFIPRRKTEK